MMTAAAKICYDFEVSLALKIKVLKLWLVVLPIFSLATSSQLSIPSICLTLWNDGMSRQGNYYLLLIRTMRAYLKFDGSYALL